MANAVANDVEKMGVRPRQAQRIIAALKSKAGLERREGARNGEWHFETPQEP